ncbi:MAG: histidinol dehydrogenase [Actinobacteria bacterium]|nr:histidinol dehydrogenase [Actinomycetota bacterium]
MRIVRHGDFADVEEIRRALSWDFWLEETPAAEVKEIIDRVRQGGDVALLELTEELDGVDISSRGLRVSRAEVDASAEAVGREFAEAARAAVKSITAFHRHQTWESDFWDSEEGARLGQMLKPLHRVGAYVPGGMAAYPSTAMMTVIPAKVAGVQEIAVCVPPGRDGGVNPYTLYALKLLGVSEVYRLGGAQAIAAMAYGTETVKAVEKIVGPGNIYVTLAKKEVYGRVGIDMLAGPSELVVIADAEADEEFVTLEMLAQMEHGGGARACLITTSEELALRVGRRLEDSGEALEDRATAVLVETLEEGVRLANHLAPEHLLLATVDFPSLLPKVHNAGSVFLGTESPVALGDYAMGVNHVLPTRGAARYASPLGVYDFVKRSNIVFSNPRANRILGPVVQTLAAMEGLVRHAEAMRRHSD